VPQHGAEARKKPAEHRLLRHPHKPAAEQDSGHGFEHVHEEDHDQPVRAEGAGKIRQPRVTAAEVPDILFEKVQRGNDRAVNPAQKIGGHGC